MSIHSSTKGTFLSWRKGCIQFAAAKLAWRAIEAAIRRPYGFHLWLGKSWFDLPVIELLTGFAGCLRDEPDIWFPIKDIPSGFKLVELR